MDAAADEGQYKQPAQNWITEQFRNYVVDFKVHDFQVIVHCVTNEFAMNNRSYRVFVKNAWHKSWLTRLVGADEEIECAIVQVPRDSGNHVLSITTGTGKQMYVLLRQIRDQKLGKQHGRNLFRTLHQRLKLGPILPHGQAEFSEEGDETEHEEWY